MPRVALTGIKPTGSIHIGNYLGMIKPALELVTDFQALYFIADYHALTTERNPERLHQRTVEAAAAWLALGLDPEKVVFFRQSDIPEIFELTWILSCHTPKGLLNRAHAYKTALLESSRTGKERAADINAGLFNYPVLMAADILLFGTHVVPVGQDQLQHIEITRDIAAGVNSSYGKVFEMPEALVHPDLRIVPGLDGRKMSKSYRNTIPIFADEEVVHRQVMRIVTDSKPPDARKDPDSCNLFSLYSLFASPDAAERTRNAYLYGGARYSDIKRELIENIIETFKDGRKTYIALLADTRAIERTLQRGAAAARQIAASRLLEVRRHIGIDRPPA